MEKKRLTQEEFNKMLTERKAGRRLVFEKLDLSCLVFVGLDLRNVSFYNVDLSDAVFRTCNCIGMSMMDVDLRRTTIRDCNFTHAIFTKVDFKATSMFDCDFKSCLFDYSNLIYVSCLSCNFSRAIFKSTSTIDRVKCDVYTGFFDLVCPEEGSFIGFKKAFIYNSITDKCEYIIVKLQITKNALRSSSTSRKCRCSEAKVLGFYDIDHSPIDIEEGEKVISIHDYNFEYKLGKIVRPTEPFDPYRWNECSTGIHFFITFDEAVRYTA